MVSYRALALGAGPVEIGIIGGAFAILSLAVAVPAGRWVDRIGEPRVMIAGTVGLAAVAVALVYSSDVAALAVAMAILGLGQILAAISIQTLIANGGEPAGRDARFGVQTVVVSLGQLIGPGFAGILVAGAMAGSPAPSGGLPSVDATSAVFAAGVATSTIAAIVAVSLWRWPPSRRTRVSVASPTGHRRPESTGRAMGRILRVPSMPHAIVASMSVLSSVDILVLYLPVYGAANAIPVETIGLLLSARAGASMLARILMLPLRRLLGRRRLLVASMLLPAVVLAALPLAGGNLAALAVSMFVIGAGLGLGQPLTLSWVAERAPDDIRGTAIGLRLTANRFGQVALPAIVAVVVGAAGLAAIFWSLSILLGASAIQVARADFGEVPGPMRNRPAREAPGDG